MELNNNHSIEFNLYKIKDVDVFAVFKKNIETKLRENNIKYDIKIVDEGEMLGGSSNATYPYIFFEETIDTIVGNKKENKTERQDMLKFLFSGVSENKQPTNNNNITKERGFFDYFNNENKASKSETNNSNYDLFNSELFKTNKTEIKEVAKESSDEPLSLVEPVEKKEEPSLLVEPGDKKEAIEEHSRLVEPAEKKEVTKEAIVDDDDEDGRVNEFIKSQTTFIKVIITIYNDDKNEKVLPTIIGIRKWGFS